jgi:MFS family permease
MLAISRSPLAAAGVVVAALSGASFRMTGPIFGQQVGLEITTIAYFLASFVLGGAIAQYPIGFIADKIDRRWVLIWLSFAAILSCMVTANINTNNTYILMLTAGIFGFTTFPIFSVAAAHAHDFAQDYERVELSAALMFFYAVGAIAAPYTASILMQSFGPSALFYLIAFGHVGLVVFGFYRMLSRPSVEEKTDYIYSPRTSFLIGRLLKSHHKDNK